MFEFRLKFHWSLIPGSNWQSSSIGSVNGLATGVKAIVWTNDGYQVYRRIYASLGLFGLTRLYWDWLSQFSPYAFIVFWIVLVYCMPQYYMGSNKDFLNWIELRMIGRNGMSSWFLRPEIEIMFSNQKEESQYEGGRLNPTLFLEFCLVWGIMFLLSEKMFSSVQIQTSTFATLLWHYLLWHETKYYAAPHNFIPPVVTWWRHQMETFSALLALCAGNSSVTGAFPSQRPVTRSFDVFFDLLLNKKID